MVSKMGFGPFLNRAKSPQGFALTAPSLAQLEKVLENLSQGPVRSLKLRVAREFLFQA